jgi:AcrR family transcriptional regulator
MHEEPAILDGMSVDRTGYHHGNLREALVAAAAGLVEQHGVSGLSLRGVAREAGVSQAAPYHHFSNKESLLAEVAVRGFGALRVALLGAVGGAATHEDRMREAGRAYVAFALQNPALYRLMFGPEFCPKEDHPALGECSTGTLGMLIEMLAEGMEAGAFQRTDPIATSMAVWSSVHGLASLLLDKVPERKAIQGMELTRDAMITATLDLVLAGLRPRA